MTWQLIYDDKRTISPVISYYYNTCIFSNLKFLATLLFLLWNSALLYWNIPEVNCFQWLKMAYFRLIKQLWGFLKIIFVLGYAKCGAITIFLY